MFTVQKHESGGRHLIAWGEVTLCPCGVDGFHVHSSYERVDKHGSVGLYAQNYATIEEASAAFKSESERIDRILAEINRDANQD